MGSSAAVLTAVMANNSGGSGSSLFGRMSARSSFMSKKDIKVSVQLLNDSDSIVNEFKRNATGKEVLDYVCECMNIQERDYLGLRYQDHHKYRYWVDLSLPLTAICKQFKSDNLPLRLRFRYYPSSPSLIREELTRYQLSVQLQRDLLHGRLYCPQPVSAQLAALVLQGKSSPPLVDCSPLPAQVGDYDEETSNGDRYVSEYKLLLKQTPKTEASIAAIHKELKGMSPSDAEIKMLQLASQVETYGFDPYTVKDAKKGEGAVYIGATHKGIFIYHGSQKTHHIQWYEVSKVDYSGSELLIYPGPGYEPIVDHPADMANGSANETLPSVTGAGSKGAPVLRFLCPSRTFAKHLWVHILSQKAFFNESAVGLIKPTFSKPRIPLLTRGTTFRFPSQRVLKEIENSPIEERHVSFMRYELPRQPARSDAPLMTKYQTLPTLKLNGNVSKMGEESLPGSPTSPRVQDRTEVVHMSLVEGESPSTSFTPPPSDVNVSTFSVHLVKMDSSTPDNLHNILHSFGPPIAQSTPLAVNGVSKRMNGVRPRDISPIPSSHKVSEEEYPSVVEVKERSVRRGLVSLLLMTLMMVVLVTLLLVFLFEESPWVKEIPLLTQLRYSLYEPARGVVVSHYKKVFAL